MTLRALILSTALVSLLGACGNDDQRVRDKRLDSLMLNSARQLVGMAVETPERATAEQLRLIGQEIAQTKGLGIMIAQTPMTGGADLFALATVDGSYTVWGSDSQITVTLEGPMLIGTRGFGDDLMSAEIGPVNALLAARSEGDYQRVLRFLDGENNVRQYVYDCRLIVINDDTMQENCTNPEHAFKNLFEFDTETGLVRRSEQWMGSATGYLVIEII